MKIKKGARVIDKKSGERGEVSLRIGREVVINWDCGVEGAMYWPARDFIPETRKNISRYCSKPKEVQP